MYGAASTKTTGEGTNIPEPDLDPDLMAAKKSGKDSYIPKSAGKGNLSISLIKSAGLNHTYVTILSSVSEVSRCTGTVFATSQLTAELLSFEPNSSANRTEQWSKSRTINLGPLLTLSRGRFPPLNGSCLHSE